jgi:hypothetical protein
LVNDDYENLTADTLMVRYYRFPTPRDMRFHILNLDNKKLILARGDALWSFRKY